MEIKQALDLINSGGVIAVLLLVIVGGMRGWYVWRREFEALREDRDFWRQTAQRGLETADRSLNLTERRQA